jgi:rod shape-determining protein MreC
MLEIILRYHKALSFFSIVIICIFFLNRKTEQKLVLAQSLQHTLLYPIQFVVNKTTKISRIFWENDSLRAQNSRLIMENQKARVWARENRRLRELLGFKSQSRYTFIPAEVVSHNPDPIINAFTVNGGYRDGIQRNMAVISTQGLVGKIVEAYPFTSLVQLLNNPNIRVSIMIRGKGIRGIMECNDGLHASVKLRKHYKIVAGDTVITSGLGGIYPEGLNVGVVRGLEDTGDQLFNTASVAFLNDFSVVKNLFVIKKSDSWSRTETFRAQKPDPGADDAGKNP